MPALQVQNYNQMSGDYGNWQNQYGQLGMQTDAQLSGDMLRFAEARSDPYPNPAGYQKSNQNAANLALLQRYYGGGY